MTGTRFEILQNMVAQDPTNNMARYGLAMEYKNQGQFARAVEEFRALLGINPNYAAAYFHCGQALEKAGLLEEARGMYQEGIDATTRIGDTHTRSELQAAMDML
jgi:cytochrome c-type biogenesis protein CcmH/NrfG